ncbi:golgin candidate 4 [Diospyros lotus]|uniref:golgin candidate 4 n=1 Tax=Diospyros lotus TaxID=55363 RepID=UPI0022557A03|nr:golgin candidate 4 [Diospyros lotus]
MWSSIANLKENLHKIALDVHDDEELQIYNSPARESPPFSDRRFAHTLAHSSPASRSPRANGFDSPYDSEIEQYRSEIKRLQESEAEIKAISVNYAALLKEKEDWISRLDAENRSLKQNLDATNAALNASRNESFKTSANNLNGLKGTNDQSPSRQHKAIVKNRSVGNQANNGAVSKQDGLSNGVGQSMQPDFIHNKTEVKRYGQDREKELADLLEEKNRSLVAIQAASESQIQKLGFELQKEQDKLADVQLRLQEEQKLNGSIQDELNSLKMDKDKTVTEMNKVNAELSEKITEVGRLQMELNRRENEKTDEIAENLKRVIAALEKENNNLKMEKVQLEAALQAASNSSVHKIPHGAQENSNKQSASLNENMQPFGRFPGKQEMELNLQKVEKDLDETRQQRDKALQELNRLKKHLLDKELEESEKMDEDSKIIEDLREKNEYQRLQILHLEKALKQAIASQEEAQMANKNELQKCNEIIDDLNRKLKSYTSTIDAKNIELLNLQTALGQYYAEIEAKEQLEGDLAHAREESAKLSELLKDAHQQADIYRREKEDILEKLSRAETIIADGRNRIHKLEEDNAKILRALEQSMSRINRMSMDSDYYVDRRIVIKLLVTYFQRNHSKEVLDLMVRMLGFSDEDKQKIGVAQQGAGKGVRRVLGLPGRLVGGILGGTSTEANANMASENQSFADLWVDFLLEETEERQRRESAEAINALKGNQQKQSPTNTGSALQKSDHRTNTASGTSPFSSLSPSLNQNSALSSYQNILPSEHSDSEFSTVPLNSAERTSQISSRLLPRY